MQHAFDFPDFRLHCLQHLSACCSCRNSSIELLMRSCMRGGAWQVGIIRKVEVELQTAAVDLQEAAKQEQHKMRG